MQKLDRLVWAAATCFATHGLRIGIRASVPEALAGFASVLPPGAKRVHRRDIDRLYSLITGGNGPRRGVHRLNVLYGNERRVVRSLNMDDIFAGFEADVRLFVADQAPRRVFVHAGVVGWQGQAIVIPGPSFTGKTALVEALVRKGATYYSDEFAVFDEHGRVHPFPIALSIRDAPDARPRRCAPEALGGRAGSVPLSVGLLLVTRYRPGARWQPRPLSQGQAVLACLANTVPARRRPGAALATLRKVVSGAPVLKGVRGEAEELAETVLHGLSERVSEVRRARRRRS